MVEENGRRYPTWQWLAVTVMGILLSLSLLAYSSMDKRIVRIEEQKADKEAIAKIEKAVEKINDNLIQHMIDTGGKPKR